MTKLLPRTGLRTVPRPSGGLRQQMKAERRGFIVEAAREVFYESGFEAAPTSEIAARAGVAAGTIFSYFATKELMLLAVVWEDLAVHLAEVERQDSAILIDGLMTFYRQAAVMLADRPTLARPFARLAATSSSAEIEQATGAPRDPLDAASLMSIERAMAQGELPADLNASQLAANVRAVFFDVLNREAEWAEVDRMLDERFAPRLRLQIAPLVS
ncbi:transcriptional regulator, TetR family [Novosphingobium sp. Rr 2-17]|uniref:TetR/AcrR family transcriptional regulator n=1 Tax=Novosphingobium sp. Rr 2-17 TaxID=555793 RepID=UPI000269825E|nr:TetR/AcrR family transcriptional regulator [Novosphingobium sp. Rr 2-17]EIZ77731.1 transcriptional regulator, TetR family [Novosphingobium sp. Rr 2-17]